MKKCKNCNMEINDYDRFCPNCGAEQDEAAVLSAPEPTPFAGADANQTNQQKNIYFTPGTDAQPTAFNSGAVVENVGAPKKKKGGKTVLIIIAVFVICFIAGAVKGFLSADDVDSKNDSSNPSVSTSEKAGGKKVIDEGVTDETGYTNASLGLRINCPDGWEVLAGDDMSDFLEIHPDADGKYVDYNGDVYEFVAVNSENGSNIMVLTFEGNLADALLNEDELIEDIADDFREDGETVSDPFKMIIGGETYNCIDADSETQGVDVKQRMLVVKEGKYYFEIFVTVFPEFEDTSIDALIENYFSSSN